MFKVYNKCHQPRARKCLITSSELVCASYEPIYVPHNLLPEGISFCLQTCNFVVIFMLMNNVCVQSFNFI